MKLKIYNDIHRYGPHELKHVLQYESDSYYLGDNIDLVYCKKSEVEVAKAQLDRLRQFAGDKFISGNHEGTRDNLYQIVDNVLLIHGDLIMESPEYIEELRGSTPPRGASWFTRFWVWLYEKVTPGQPHFLWTSKIKSAASYAKALDCKTVVMGHNHPSHRYDKVVEGVRIIGLKRGYNEVDL